LGATGEIEHRKCATKLRPVGLEPAADGGEEGFRLFEIGQVAAFLEDGEFRTRDARVHDLRLRGWADEVVTADEDEGGGADLAEATRAIRPSSTRTDVRGRGPTPGP